MTDLVANARALVAPGKGLLAADESVRTATKRLASHGIGTSEEMRRQYRSLFLGAEGVEEYLSGVILFSETFEQKGDDGELFPDSLAAHGIAPGIKVDESTEPFPESPDELITKGLIGLPERLAFFKQHGAVFTKWRAVLKIDGNRLPSAAAVTQNVKRLARYAKEAQAAGLVPIVEPEVLLDGAHSRGRARKVIEETLSALFAALEAQAVDRASVILKTAMALSGSESGRRDTPQEVAEDTLAALAANVPRQVPGIVFLSGGQTPDEATENLAAIAARARETQAPWPLTFSYARALQDEALAAWGGKKENVRAARDAFLARLMKVSHAARGEGLAA